ncbi:hypothetical protein BKE30_14745 [Alkanindiges hydrocarboniclasticus]|uniref:Uncharacterized protein n=1 Tax=Alkanindiges hydrocarboniclasticus TaxID=1907941 RepID=A0A1S8CQE4_9GAMM|nr:hypothetical protein [Alkanindiges hydrocarboniclasticus]ONG37384.1 hypothetical protein BKE30_14745 [Alkanindiges hydrocarboniclasticus]
MIPADQPQLARGKAKFWLAVNNNDKRVLGAIMFPNIYHIPDNRKNKLYKKYRKEALLLLGIHEKFVETGSLVIQQSGSLAVGMTTNRKLGNGQAPTVFNFNSNKHRFKEMSSATEEDSPNNLSVLIRQQDYLSAEVIFRAWAAIDNGLIVGLIVFPHINDSGQYHSKQFYQYKNKARAILQKVGYVISGDLVLDQHQQVRFYTYHQLHRHAYRTISNWVKEYGLTKSLKEFIN